MTARRPNRLRQLAARLRPHVRGVCRCPACDKAEQRARAKLGMARLHPERIALDPSPAEQAFLDRLREAAWPNDEDAAIILEFRQEDRP